MSSSHFATEAPVESAIAMTAEDEPDDRRFGLSRPVSDEIDPLPLRQPSRSHSLPLRPALVRRRSIEHASSGFGPLATPSTPDSPSAAVFGTSASSTTSSAMPSPAMSRRSSSSGSSCAKSVRFANSLVMSVMSTHSPFVYDRAPWHATDCDILAIPACKRDEEIDRWLRVEIDRPLSSVVVAPSSPRRLTPPSASSSSHDLSFSSLALTSSRRREHSEDSSDHDDPSRSRTSLTHDRWPSGSTLCFAEGDVLGGF